MLCCSQETQRPRTHPTATVVYSSELSDVSVGYWCEQRLKKEVFSMFRSHLVMQSNLTFFFCTGHGPRPSSGSDSTSDGVQTGNQRFYWREDSSKSEREKRGWCCRCLFPVDWTLLWRCTDCISFILDSKNGDIRRSFQTRSSETQRSGFFATRRCWIGMQM